MINKLNYFSASDFQFKIFHQRIACGNFLLNGLWTFRTNFHWIGKDSTGPVLLATACITLFTNKGLSLERPLKWKLSVLKFSKIWRNHFLPGLIHLKEFLGNLIGLTNWWIMMIIMASIFGSSRWILLRNEKSLQIELSRSYGIRFEVSNGDSPWIRIAHNFQTG